MKIPCCLSCCTLLQYIEVQQWPINSYHGTAYQSAQEHSNSILAVLSLSRIQQTVPSVGLFYAGISQYIYPQVDTSQLTANTTSTQGLHHAKALKRTSGNAGFRNMALIVVIWNIHYTSHTHTTTSQWSISD